MTKIAEFANSIDLDEVAHNDSQDSGQSPSILSKRKFAVVGILERLIARVIQI